jgi:hypothetical protein
MDIILYSLAGETLCVFPDQPTDRVDEKVKK